MDCSPDTLLRLLRRLPDDPIEPPRVVSFDEWTKALEQLEQRGYPIKSEDVEHLSAY